MKEYTAEYRKNHAAEIKQHNELNRINGITKTKANARRRTTRGRQVSIWSNLKGRASKLGLEFDLTHDDIVIPEFCPILGIPISTENDRMGDSSPSVDRIDNTKGYIKGNIGIISMRANRLKSDSNIQELEAILKYMKSAHH
jgi:hypothetical protein